jgi:hypothetical protein
MEWHCSAGDAYQQHAQPAAHLPPCVHFCSAPFLTILAPGAIINAGGWSMAGTSQAVPHVTGSIAVRGRGLLLTRS